MLSKKSSYKAGNPESKFFSKALFLQTVDSLLPIPICYFFVLFLALPMNIFLWDEGVTETVGFYLELAQYVEYARFYGLSTAFLLGNLSALMVYRYLFVSRSANMIHSLPVRREAFFWTQYLAGLSFVLVPNLLILILTLIACTFHGVFFFQPFIYLFLLQSAFYLFFYSFSVCCAAFTGSPGAVSIYYLIFNFLVAFITLLMDPVFEMYYIGYTGNILQYPFVQLLTPIFALAVGGRVHVDNFGKTIKGDRYAWGSVENPLPENLSFRMEDTHIIYAYLLVAVIMVLVSLFVYLRRHIESAGEAVSVPEMKPVFRLAIAVVGGFAMGIVTVVLILEDLFHSAASFVLPASSLLWGIAFALVAEMILQKTFRVLKSWKTTILPVCALALIYLGISMDITGFESYVPEKEKVENVTVFMPSGYPIDSGSKSYYLFEAKNMEQERYDVLTKLHTMTVPLAKEYQKNYTFFLENGLPEGEENHFLELTYHLENGYSSERQYMLSYQPSQQNQEGTYAYFLHQFYNDKTILGDNYSFDEMLNGRILGIELEMFYDTILDEFSSATTDTFHEDRSNAELREMNTALVEAMAKDFAEGNLGEKFLSYDDPDFVEDGYFGRFTIVWEKATTTSSSSSGLAYQGEETADVTGEGNPQQLSDSGALLAVSSSVSLSKKAVHSLAVLEEYGFLGHYEMSTNYQVLEKYRDWYNSENHDDLSKFNDFVLSISPEEQDINDPMTFVDALIFAY
ncbi:MAG: hypothetical protein R3Y63_13050 [Eubacteriales bacterium]